jgi:hypothetical protein
MTVYTDRHIALPRARHAGACENGLVLRVLGSNNKQSGFTPYHIRAISNFSGHLLPKDSGIWSQLRLNIGPESRLDERATVQGSIYWAVYVHRSRIELEATSWPPMPSRTMLDDNVEKRLPCLFLDAEPFRGSGRTLVLHVTSPISPHYYIQR